MADEATPVSATTGKNPFAGIKFAVEFATDHNNQTLCPISMRTYRGRFEMQNVKGRMPDDRFVNMPDIPGEVILVDGTARVVEVRDPLSDPDARETLKEARAVHRAMNWKEPDPNETKRIDPANDDDLKRHVYWCRRWLDAKQIVVLHGKIPPMDVILLLPGRLEFHSFDQDQERDKHSQEYGKGRVRPYKPPAFPKKKRRGE